jgi:transcription elongation factor Elf1
MNVARCCGIWLKESNNNEVKARCPFCGGGHKHRLTASINVNKNLFYCHRCGEGHNAVTLYAKLVGTDNRWAYNALKEVAA